MTATDELRALLDERGVEWGNTRSDGSESDYLTEWRFKGIQGKAIAIEWAVGRGLSVEIHRDRLAPSQAIAATLGTPVTGETSDGYEGAPGTRYSELFGSPERAAETMYTLMLNCARGDGPCERCPAFPRCNWASDDGEETESMMLEWLRGDAE